MLKSLKNVFFDLFLLYKNYFSWTKVRIFSWIFGYILWWIIALPVLILAIFYWYKNWIKPDSIIWDYWNNVTLYLLNIAVYFCIAIWFLYNYVFLIKFYKWLISEKKNLNFALFKNFFDKKLFSKSFFLLIIFVATFWWIALFLMFVLSNLNSFIWLKESLNIIQNSYFNIFTILFFIGVIIIIYLFYKFIFAFAFLVDEDLSIKESLIKSFKKTKWFKKFFNTFVVTFIIMLLYSPFYNFQDNFKKEKEDLSQYIKYTLALAEEQKQTTIWWEKISLTDEQRLKYQTLSLKYQNKSGEETKKLYEYVNSSLWIISFVYFFLFFGIGIMAYTSIYNNIIKD